MFAATDWNTILIALIAMIGTSFGAWLAYKTAQNAKTIDKVHVLVNSSHGVALKAVAELTAAKFERTKAAADELEASNAMKAWLSHQAAQAKIDAKL